MKSWQLAIGTFLPLLSLNSGSAATLAQFRAAFGNLEVELYDHQKPVTMQNSKPLVQSGAYQNGNPLPARDNIPAKRKTMCSI